MPDWVDAEQQTLLDLLERRLSRDPDGPFLDCCGTPYTAAELVRESSRVAGALAEMGVRHGSTVATMLENGPAAVVSWFAVHKLGAISVPVNTALKGSLLRHQLTDADTAVVIAAADLGTIIYTGGTTGSSKGCALSHNYHLMIARQIISSWGRTPDDVVWSPLPLFHFNAISCMLTGTLISGGRAALARRFSVSAFWPQINRSGATIASLLGSLAVMVARADDHPQARQSGAAEANTTLRLLTGAPMPPEIDQRFRQRFGISTFSNAYGTTEASLISWLPPGRPGRPGSAGIVNSEAFIVKIFDDDDREPAAGGEGEIVCRPRMPHAMFEGYWKRPEATVAARRNLWFHTGDIGRIDEDGYLYFVDRKADYMRRRGENISSWEVEKVFHEHPDVKDVCVHAVPSDVSEDDAKGDRRPARGRVRHRGADVPLGDGPAALLCGATLFRVPRRASAQRDGPDDQKRPAKRGRHPGHLGSRGRRRDHRAPLMGGETIGLAGDDLGRSAAGKRSVRSAGLGVGQHERRFEHLVQRRQRQPLGAGRQLRGLDGADYAGEHPGQQHGIARPQLARLLTSPEQIRLQPQGGAEVLQDLAVIGRLGQRRSDRAAAQHEPAELREPPEEADLPVREVEQLPAWRPAGGQCRAHARQELRPPPQEDLPVDVILAREEAVDRADGEFRELRDLPQGRLVKALAAEYLLGRVEDLVPAEGPAVFSPLLSQTALGHRLHVSSRTADCIVTGWSAAPCPPARVRPPVSPPRVRGPRPPASDGHFPTEVAVTDTPDQLPNEIPPGFPPDGLADGVAAEHPALAGRARESGALADAVRRLIGLCLTTTAPAEATMAAARDLEAIAEALQRHVPDPPLPKNVMTGPAAGAAGMAARMPFDVVLGRHNPLALPLDLSFDPPLALLRGAFTRPYEGPPGCVHGGVLAASFDLVLAAANLASGLTGPTARLEIVYRRPTALYEPCLFEGRVDAREGRRVRTVGRLIQHDRVTVEAAGEFVLLGPEDIARMAERAHRR
jgi:acyl-CoA synthetase (AMP-forming)/AMP-acid ligase II